MHFTKYRIYCNFGHDGYTGKNIQVEIELVKTPVVTVHRWLEPFIFVYVEHFAK